MQIPSAQGCKGESGVAGQDPSWVERTRPGQRLLSTTATAECAARSDSLLRFTRVSSVLRNITAQPCVCTAGHTTPVWAQILIRSCNPYACSQSWPEPYVRL